MSIFQASGDVAEVPVSVLRDGGALISVWGSSGAGKSTVALNLAFELCSMGHKVLLVDADSYSPALSAALGVLKPAGGILSALRLARQQRLSVLELERLTEVLIAENQPLQFLSGVSSALRWSEFDSVRELVSTARTAFDFVIADLATPLEPGIYGPESSTPRNQATLGFIGESDLVLGLFAADPVGVNRHLWDLRLVNFDIWPVANRVRTQTLGRNPERQLRDAIYSLAKRELRQLLPEDQAATDAALLKGQPLLVAAKSSKLREAIRRLAIDVSESGTKLQNREHRSD